MQIYRLIKSSNINILLILLLFLLPLCKNKERPAMLKNKQLPLPNIVIIFTDDQGYADVGCFGAKTFKTPNIDKMADEGMRFTNFYVSEAVCSASRASLLTGCYAERISIIGALMPFTSRGLNPNEVTIAELLKSKGYTTGMVGKWHLGHYKKFLPLQNGFDVFFGLPYSNDMWPVDYDGKLIDKSSEKPWKAQWPTLALIDGNEKIDEIQTLDDQATLTRRYTQRAVRFIKRNKDKPFFLYFAHSMPHVPLGVSDNFKGKSDQGMYGDVIEEIDWSVGQIIETLKKFQLEDNTLIIYTSDNGPWLSYGNHGGSAYPLRGGKFTAFEGGIREPTIIKWPGHIPEGKVCSRIASTIDILPTLAAITGAEIPDKPIDGVSILPLMEDNCDATPRDEFFYYYYGELRAVRKGKWKLFFPHNSLSYEGMEPGKDGLPGKTKVVKVDLELYDLENDIGERDNVAVQYPEIVDSLNVIANKMREKLGDKLTNTKGNSIRPPGEISALKSFFVAIGRYIKRF
jgi:arylsulfatase